MRSHSFLLVVLAFVAGVSPAQDVSQLLVYADFEKVQDGRPLSARDGTVTLTGYQQNNAKPTAYSNSDQPYPRAPLVLPAADNFVSQRVAFDFQISTPNEWAGVNLTVRGLPDTDGKATAEDMSAYSSIRFKVSVAGARSLKVELISKDNGINVPDGSYPQTTFTVKDENYNVYRIPLKRFAQPSWAKEKTNVKDALKKLTAVQFTVQDVPSKGRIVLDNIVFEKEPIK
ncbi:MAG TPA: carbohydrate binding domain-containing protein [Pyrinomonadaceae bacterium]|nr:carbohydrate binding domain-containing protein [Pyrinomonadaceae bacterium]